MKATFRGEQIEVVHLDVLVQYCGFFDGRAETNNGYGCTHPKQEHRDRANNLGQCFDFSCPIASSVDPGESEEDDAILTEIGEPGATGYMDVHDVDVVARLTK